MVGETETRLPQSDPRVLESSNALAQMRFVKGNYSESAVMYISNMALAKQHLEEENPISLRCISGLATVHSLQGRWAEPIAMAGKSLEGQTQLLGPMHQETLGGYELTGELVTTGINHIKDLSIEELRQEGENLVQVSLRGRRNLLGKEHPDTLKSLHNLARALMAQKRYLEAEEALIEHQEMVKRVLGTDHRDHLKEAEATHEHLDVANSIWQLGVLQQSMECYEQAIDNFNLLEPLDTEAYSPNHQYPIKPMAKIGEIYVTLGRYAQSRPLLVRLTDNCDDTSVSSIEITQKSAKLLEFVYRELGQKKKAEDVKNRSWDLKKPTEISPHRGFDSWSARALAFALLLVLLFLNHSRFISKLVNLTNQSGDRATDIVATCAGDLTGRDAVLCRGISPSDTVLSKCSVLKSRRPGPWHNRKVLLQPRAPIPYRDLRFRNAA